MTVIIFQKENNSTEEWLRLNHDGTVSFHIENSGWPMARSGLKPREENMTTLVAKERWPSYAAKIDEALTQLSPIAVSATSGIIKSN